MASARYRRQLQRAPVTASRTREALGPCERRPPPHPCPHQFTSFFSPNEAAPCGRFGGTIAPEAAAAALAWPEEGVETVGPPEKGVGGVGGSLPGLPPVGDIAIRLSPVLTSLLRYACWQAALVH